MNQLKNLLEEAEKFIYICYQELDKSTDAIEARMEAIRKEIKATNTYTHTFEELKHGAKMAWRNSNRCIGRLFWDILNVLDARELDHTEDVAEALLHHIDYATNKGKIRPTITVFKPQVAGVDAVRIWNHQLVRYAGYMIEDKIIGDSTSIAFTKICEQLGWSGNGTAFDVLPLVIQINQDAPQLFEIPTESVLEVDINHPEIPAISDLRLKWYAVPMISDMRLEIGGIQYVAAPFNGWYMGTEIGARNLADADRYNALPAFAELMGLSTSSNQTLWKDKALVELNIAVLDSYRKAGVNIVDHHTAAQQYKVFERKEKSADRALTGDWTWLIPPLSPATTHIFSKPYNNQIISPNYFYQKAPY